MSSVLARRAVFRDVLGVGEFRALWASQGLSEAGDRLALVALTLLVYDQTRSPLLSALAYGAGFVPWLIGGPVLSGLGDRLPRREVMVACDLIRAVLVTVMLLPGMPVGALVGLLYATTMAQAPFEAARSAILPDIFEGERYALAAAVMQTSFRLALVGGAAIAGVTIAFIGTRPALGVDAATFVASAALLRFGTRARPAAAGNGGGRPGTMKGLGEGARHLLGDRRIRTLMMLGWLIALYSIPEGIAAPYAARLGGGPAAAGLVIASGQAGAVLAAPVFTRAINPLTRLRWMGPMAVCTCAVLLLTLFRPGLGISMAIFALSGTFAIYQITANTAFVDWVPDSCRAQAFGLASTGTVASQGTALMLAGAAAQLFPPATVIAVGGGLGTLTACGLALRWRHIPTAAGRHTARPLPAMPIAAMERRNAPFRIRKAGGGAGPERCAGLSGGADGSLSVRAAEARTVLAGAGRGVMESRERGLGRQGRRGRRRAADGTHRGHQDAPPGVRERRGTLRADARAAAGRRPDAAADGHVLAEDSG